MTISFRAGVNHQMNQPAETNRIANARTAKAEINETPEDSVDITTNNENKDEMSEKTSVWQNIKNGYTNFRKGLITAGHYVVGTVKGLIYGSAAAGAVIAVDGVRGIVNKSPNYISKKGKVLAAVAGAAVLTWNLFNANLNANEKKAQLDHRWQTGHNR